MGLAKRPLRKLPGVSFSKVLSAGRGEGFHPAPNWGVYGLLATWPSLDEARRTIDESKLFNTYRKNSFENWTVYLSAVRAHGLWDGREPFETNPAEAAPAPLGVLTRATIRWSRLRPFWRSVPAVSLMTVGRAPLRFSIGVGELPIIELMTFSIWDSDAAMKEYAYQNGAHKETMLAAKKDGWFREDLFVRFRILESQGSWHGQNLLSDVSPRALPSDTNAAPAVEDAAVAASRS